MSNIVTIIHITFASNNYDIKKITKKSTIKKKTKLTGKQHNLSGHLALKAGNEGIERRLGGKK